MPFDFDYFQSWCRDQSDAVLQEYYQKYVRQTAQGTTGQMMGYGMAVFTCGIPLIGVALSAAEMANAGVKVGIIKDEMNRRRREHALNLRVRDVFRGIASGSTGLITTPASHMVGHVLSAAAS